MWNKNEFGNTFTQKATLEDIIRIKEAQLEVDPSPKNRPELSKIEAELKKFIKLEEEFWKQKSSMMWFAQGDKNTKNFHCFVQGRRRKVASS